MSKVTWAMLVAVVGIGCDTTVGDPPTDEDETVAGPEPELEAEQEREPGQLEPLSATIARQQSCVGRSPGRPMPEVPASRASLPCAGDIVFEVGNVINDDGVDGIAVDDQYVYYATGGELQQDLYRRPQTGGRSELLLANTSSELTLFVDDTYLYLLDANAMQLGRMPKAGGTLEVLDDLNYVHTRVAARSGTVFYSKATNSAQTASVIRVDPDGTSTVLLETAGRVHDLVLHGDRLLTFTDGLECDSRTDLLVSIGLDGSDLNVLADEVRTFGKAGVADGRVYFFQHAVREVQSIRLDGSDRRVEATLPVHAGASYVVPVWQHGWIVLYTAGNEAGRILEVAEHSSNPALSVLDIDTVASRNLNQPALGPDRVAWANVDNVGNSAEIHMRCLAPQP